MFTVFAGFDFILKTFQHSKVDVSRVKVIISVIKKYDEIYRAGIVEYKLTHHCINDVANVTFMSGIIFMPFGKFELSMKLPLILTILIFMSNLNFILI